MVIRFQQPTGIFIIFFFIHIPFLHWNIILFALVFFVMEDNMEDN